MGTHESPKWVQPFRFLAFVFGVLSIPALVLHFRSPSPAGLSLGMGGVATVALLCFAFIPRRLLSGFWLVAALLACAGLSFTLFQLWNLASREIDTVLLSGHVLIAAVFIVMLIEAVQRRP